MYLLRSFGFKNFREKIRNFAQFIAFRKLFKQNFAFFRENEFSERKRKNCEIREKKICDNYANNCNISCKFLDFFLRIFAMQITALEILFVGVR